MVYCFHSKPITSVFKLRLQSCTAQWCFMQPHPSITSMSRLILIFPSCTRQKVHLNSNKLHIWDMRTCLVLLDLHATDYYFALKPISDVFDPLWGPKLKFSPSLNTCLGCVDKISQPLGLETAFNSNREWWEWSSKACVQAGLEIKLQRAALEQAWQAVRTDQKVSLTTAITKIVTKRYWVADSALLEMWGCTELIMHLLWMSCMILLSNPSRLVKLFAVSFSSLTWNLS